MIDTEDGRKMTTFSAGLDKYIIYRRLTSFKVLGVEVCFKVSHRPWSRMLPSSTNSNFPPYS